MAGDGHYLGLPTASFKEFHSCGLAQSVKRQPSLRPLGASRTCPTPELMPEEVRPVRAPTLAGEHKQPVAG